MIKIYGDYSPITYSALTFSAGERHIQIEMPEVAPRLVIVRALVYDSAALVELIMLLDALRSNFPDSEIRLTMPYLPYSRQDRVCAAGQADAKHRLLSILLGGDLVDTLSTWDMHSESGQIGFDSRLNNMELFALLAECRANLPDGAVVVAPDQGAEERARDVADRQGLRLALMSKNRDPETGALSNPSIQKEGSEHIEGAECWLVDDICDGGYTFVLAAKLLKEAGASSVNLLVTHGIFSKGLQVFDGLIDNVISTNSFPAPALVQNVCYTQIEPEIFND